MKVTKNEIKMHIKINFILIDMARKNINFKYSNNWNK